MHKKLTPAALPTCQEVVCNELRPGWILKTPGEGGLLICTPNRGLHLKSNLLPTLITGGFSMLFWNVNFAWLLFGFCMYQILIVPGVPLSSQYNHNTQGQKKLLPQSWTWKMGPLQSWILDSSHLGRIFHINHFFWGEMPKKTETSLQFFQPKKIENKSPHPIQSENFRTMMRGEIPKQKKSIQSKIPFKKMVQRLPSHPITKTPMLLGALVRSKSKGSDEQQVLRAALVCVSSGPGP